MAKNTGRGSRHNKNEHWRWYSHREILDPYRMEDAEKEVVRAKLKALIYDDARHADVFDVLFGMRKMWATGLVVFVISAVLAAVLNSEAAFFSLCLPMWAAWWVFYLSYWPRAKRAWERLDKLDREDTIDRAYEGYALSLYNVAESLRSLPRELREAHRALWDSALAGYNVLKYGEDEQAREALETAEDRAAELAKAQKELVSAVKADKRALEFQAARAALSSSTLHAHEAAHADAQALLEGAHAMREMTKALTPKDA